jgi:hypothetical protein
MPVYRSHGFKRWKDVVELNARNLLEGAGDLLLKTSKAVIRLIKSVGENTMKCVKTRDTKACWETVKFGGGVAFAVAGVACFATGACGLGISVATGVWATLKLAVDMAVTNKEATHKKTRAVTLLFGVAIAAGTITAECSQAEWRAW